MKKYTVVLSSLALVVAVAAVGISPTSASKNGRAGKSNVAHLYLYEKDSSDWSIVDGGAWGKMKYNLSGPAFDYVFNGHGLVPGDDYTLIYYPDPWPGTGLQCLGTGVANGGGNVNISGAVETGTLPTTSDANYSWNVNGSWVIDVNYLGQDYQEDLVLQQSGANITGTSLELVGGGSPWTIDSGTVSGNSIDFEGYFNSNSSMRVHFTGTIAAEESMSGTWADKAPGTRTGTWTSTSGTAVPRVGAKIWLVKSEDVACEAVTWNVKGTYIWSVFGVYFHDITITTQNPDGTFSGTGGYPASSSPYTAAGQTTETITGQVTGNTITLTTTYDGPYNTGYTVTATGTIDSDGTISGTLPWEWSLTGGSATPVVEKMVGWNPTEYLFENNLINFTSNP